MAGLSSKLPTWEAGFHLRPGGSEPQRLPPRKMAGARSGGNVLGYYFLGQPPVPLYDLLGNKQATKTLAWIL